MRCGFDRLAKRVTVAISHDPVSRHWFMLRFPRSERLKILTWDRNGHVLRHKRLEAGVFELPCIKEGDPARRQPCDSCTQLARIPLYISHRN